MLPLLHGLVKCWFIWSEVLSWVHGPVMWCDGFGMACFGAVCISGVTSLVALLCWFFLNWHAVMYLVTE